MCTLLFTPRSLITTNNKQNYIVSGYTTIDVVEYKEDLDDCVFASKIHYELYETLKKYGTFQLVNTENL